MADLFVSLVAIVPKPSQAATQPVTSGLSTQDISGVHTDIQTNKVTTPGGQSK